MTETVFNFALAAGLALIVLVEAGIWRSVRVNRKAAQVAKAQDVDRLGALSKIVTESATAQKHIIEYLTEQQMPILAMLEREVPALIISGAEQHNLNVTLLNGLAAIDARIGAGKSDADSPTPPILKVALKPAAKRPSRAVARKDGAAGKA